MDFLRTYQNNLRKKSPKRKLKISVLIPAFNEEKSIKKSVNSILLQTRKADQIVVVDDGSTDKTEAILDLYGGEVTVVELAKNSGNKSYAQEMGLRFVDSDIVIFGDADTLFDKDFILEMEKSFADPKISAVCGYVESLKHNWLTACRQIDYTIGQKIHKNAQEYFNYILVAPGCAVAFKVKDFRKTITFGHDTLTEDLDYTYTFHEAGLKFAYNPRAIVYTEDPADLYSYINQTKRWYAGGWQNLRKHIRILSKPGAALELSMAYIEGLVMPFVLLFSLIININFFYILIAFMLLYTFFISLWAAYMCRRIDLVFIFPHYLFINFINSYLFIREFINEIILKRRRVLWFKARRRSML